MSDPTRTAYQEAMYAQRNRPFVHIAPKLSDLTIDPVGLSDVKGDAECQRPSQRRYREAVAAWTAYPDPRERTNQLLFEMDYGAPPQMLGFPSVAIPRSKLRDGVKCDAQHVRWSRRHFVGSLVVVGAALLGSLIGAWTVLHFRSEHPSVRYPCSANEMPTTSTVGTPLIRESVRTMGR